ncbi:transcription initiation factor TFIID subunit 4-like [Numida meleagris]|uniref:transcription initiation factor TFIID subunit 4-like n=1 Tax=Numida meleagris TaxID=8996 RepID=UPI000B3DE013|nr:transcription initiation factor TFIID subunit 4-like [Numida meleagris]
MGTAAPPALEAAKPKVAGPGLRLAAGPAASACRQPPLPPPAPPGGAGEEGGGGGCSSSSSSPAGGCLQARAAAAAAAAAGEGWPRAGSAPRSWDCVCVYKAGAREQPEGGARHHNANPSSLPCPPRRDQSLPRREWGTAGDAAGPAHASAAAPPRWERVKRWRGPGDGKRGEGAAERRETTAHLGSAREPERVAVSSSSLIPSPFPRGARPARIAALSPEQRSAASPVLSAAPSNPSDPDNAAASPPTPAPQRAGAPGRLLPPSPLPALGLRGRPGVALRPQPLPAPAVGHPRRAPFPRAGAVLPPPRPGQGSLFACAKPARRQNTN